MLENEIQKEVNRLANAGKSQAPPVKKRVEGLIEYYKEPLTKRVMDALFEGDIRTVATSLTKEVLKPKVQDLLADLFIGGIEKWIYGDDTDSRTFTRGANGGRKASYDAYYNNGKYYTQPSAASSQANTAKVRWDRIILKTRPAAIELLDDLRNDIRKYKKVSVTDLYDYVTEIDEELGAQIESEFPDSNWGWKNLDRVPIENIRTKDGLAYWVKLPKPVDIN